MLLYQRLEFVLLHLYFVNDHFEELSPITRRMYATGLANELYQLASDLSVIDERIENTLDIEDAYLDASTYNNKDISFPQLLNEIYYREDCNSDAEINNLTDIFPLNKDGYTFTSEKAELFKTGLRYLCSDANISSRDLLYAIDTNIKDVFTLLFRIIHKKTTIKDFQYEDFWYTFLYRDDDLIPENVFNDYEKWKDEHDYKDIQVLRDKLTQEILNLLKSGIFNNDVKPVKRDIDKCIIEISEDALEEGTEIPEDIKTECARFSKYVSFKEGILCIDYKKLGKYVYKHYREINYKQGDRLIYFDYMLLKIHEDMAECNPKLKKYLRFYEDKELEEILNKTIETINSCKELLNDGVAQDFLSTYLREAFYGDNKYVVQAKLKGQSKYTLISMMLGMLKTTGKVFKLGTTSADLAKSLSRVVEKPKEDSLKRYIDKGASDYISALSKWTTQYVTNKLGSNSERLFVEVSQK